MVSLGNGGWIKLHRKILDNWIWEDPEKLRAWIDILLMVNHEDKQIPFNGHIITIRKGQKLTSLYKLAERWNWTRGRVSRFLQLLDEAGMVTADRTPNGTLLTVVNWELYQDTQNTDEATYKATSDTTDRATGDTQTRKKKNYKNDKETRARAKPNSFHNFNQRNNSGLGAELLRKQIEMVKAQKEEGFNDNTT